MNCEFAIKILNSYNSSSFQHFNHKARVPDAMISTCTYLFYEWTAVCTITV